MARPAILDSAADSNHSGLAFLNHLQKVVTGFSGNYTKETYHVESTFRFRDGHSFHPHRGGRYDGRTWLFLLDVPKFDQEK
jgi:hypothetical protein